MYVAGSGTPQRKSISFKCTRKPNATFLRKAGTSIPHNRSRSACISRNVDEINN
ncbi:unnamed protein product [Schistosoma mattheei]|uniref:Uncharacterized protein n=1 Tax=Schistosoma mattheei TaxID=31246 RepID=A0A3P8DAA3_9TREM|nr:unnamed protein product [Schistosoma mattheei]